MKYVQDTFIYGEILDNFDVIWGVEQSGFTARWVLKFSGTSSWLMLSYWIVVGRLDHAFQVSRKNITTKLRKTCQENFTKPTNFNMFQQEYLVVKTFIKEQVYCSNLTC